LVVNLRSVVALVVRLWLLIVLVICFVIVRSLLIKVNSRLFCLIVLVRVLLRTFEEGHVVFLMDIAVSLKHLFVPRDLLLVLRLGSWLLLSVLL